VEGRTRPEANSLRLLPLGPDRIGEAIARADLPAWVLDDLGQQVKENPAIRRVSTENQCPEDYLPNRNSDGAGVCSPSAYPSGVASGLRIISGRWGTSPKVPSSYARQSPANGPVSSGICVARPKNSFTLSNICTTRYFYWTNFNYIFYTPLNRLLQSFLKVANNKSVNPQGPPL